MHPPLFSCVLLPRFSLALLMPPLEWRSVGSLHAPQGARKASLASAVTLYEQRGSLAS